MDNLEEENKLAVVSFVLGILGFIPAILFWFFPAYLNDSLIFIFWLAPVFSLLGLILGIISKKQIKTFSEKGLGFAIGGIVISALALGSTLWIGYVIWRFFMQVAQ